MSDKLLNQVKNLYKTAINRETMTYIVAGVLTTLVNYISYYVFWNKFGIESLISNVIAWIIAVVFAYIINNIWVFRANTISFSLEVKKIIKFFGARVFSLIIEELGLFIGVYLMHWNNLIVKAALAVVVIVLNYFFSKLFIFNNKNDTK